MPTLTERTEITSASREGTIVVVDCSVFVELAGELQAIMHRTTEYSSQNLDLFTLEHGEAAATLYKELFDEPHES